MEEQNFELKALMEYNSAEEFFDSDSEGTSNKSNKSCEVSESETSETLGSGTNSSEITIYVRHGVRIGGGGRVDKETCQILKRTYLCWHAGESKASTSCRVGCPWKLNIWAKKDKNYLEVTTFKDQHVGHKLSPLASWFVLTLQKLSEEILQEIRFLTVVAKVNATVQYRIIRKKFKTRIFQTDLYNAIDKFRREAIPGEEDAGTLLKRLYDKKDEDPRWAITMKLDSATSSLTHLFWITPEQLMAALSLHNNLKTRIVAQAIVDDESQFLYEWVFQYVKEATGVAPKVFVTNGDPAVNAAVIIQYPNAFHMHCIWHISQNLPKQLKGKLGSTYNDFIKDFYKARNSLTEGQFYERWDTLSQNYPESKDYLNRSLGQNPQSWARAFTNKYFTAGVQSTFRSEGENSTLKRLFRNSSLSLCELFDALEERYQEENDYCNFVSWKKSVPQISPKNVFKSIFGLVVKQLTEFVSPNIIKKQEE
ncbi:protein FAR-RED IMPAIRED RESPONSE 1-like [Rhizophagus irregularis DAOM 181602=DAOM 197198]|nr:protein FAR-RED IMPAIRED RESPONSE 1-like [Rhizophagus irregularis DAOM 181602=DAOM 197198]